MAEQAQEDRAFRGLFNLRRSQVDACEELHQRFVSDAQRERERMERRLRSGLLSLLERLPWKDGPRGQVIDRSRLRQIQKVRVQMQNLIDAHFRSLEKKLLDPSLRGR